MGNETKHTPGPWTAYVTTEGGFEVYQDDGHGNGDHIACMVEHAESAANARLIAAAPVLLGALRVVEMALVEARCDLTELSGAELDAGAAEGTVAGAISAIAAARAAINAATREELGS
jgi:hypothetical protein